MLGSQLSKAAAPRLLLHGPAPSLPGAMKATHEADSPGSVLTWSLCILQPKCVVLSYHTVLVVPGSNGSTCIVLGGLGALHGEELTEGSPHLALLLYSLVKLYYDLVEYHRYSLPLRLW